jgi:DtxR family transcriptional regulator, Mn-dependent transcriptional regulator
MEIHPNLENYLRAIWDIQQKGAVVRVKDLAKALGLKNGTIVSGLRTLGQKGLVVHEYYGHVELTSKGTLAAMEVMHRHEVLYAFLAGLLNLSPELAEEDACALEHYISGEGLHRLIHFIEYLRAHVDLDKVQAFLRDKVSPAPVPLSSLGAG